MDLSWAPGDVVWHADAVTLYASSRSEAWSDVGCWIQRVRDPPAVCSFASFSAHVSAGERRIA